MLVLPFLLASLPLLLVALYLQFRWQQRHILAAASKLRSPPALPLIGNALYFLGDITSVTKNIVKFTTEFKGLFCLWVGPVPVFVATDPNDVQVILNSSHTLEKDDIYNFLKPFMGNSLFTAPGHHWKKQRRLMNPLLVPSNVEKFLPEFNAVGEELARQLGQAPGEIDPRDGIFSISVDVIMRTVIASKPLSVEAKQDIFDLLNDVGKMFTYRLFKVWLHIEWLFNFLYSREMKKAEQKLAACYNLIDEHWIEAVQERGQGSKQEEELEDYRPRNILDVAFTQVNNGSNKKDWFDEINGVIVGATDTVVAAISFLLLTLANHPEIQDKVHAEIEEVLGSRSDDEVTLDDLNRLTYLGQALMETMRIHGVFPCILRKVTKDIKLSEATLPTGSRVMLTLHAMGWHPDTFPEPHKFIPGRFSPELQRDPDHKRHNYAFLPFSGGPRNCLGKAYAMLMMKTVAVHILRRFKVTTDVSLSDIQYELKVVMHSRTPLLLRFEPLLPSKV
ncbi:cytochrome P450 4V2-like [Macrosteles quadrilineatus]|uniref:cytochrome P450 4V2-like n=1 Tax=Macrosteles quadrilineatus TaxID=74068 RepID=UPI0023E34800|nr:cytochrome P450 4V2-like [Macrosteles quadrilineatus]